MKSDLRLIAEAFREFASLQGWKFDEYQVFIKPNEDWGRYRVILAAERFPRKTGEVWREVHDFLSQRFREDTYLANAITLSLTTFDQIERGGLHGIPDGYEDINDSIPILPTA